MVINRIDRILKDRNISAYKFWKMTGIGESTAYKLCRDRNHLPTPDHLVAICETFKIQPGEFLEWIEVEDSSQ